MVTKSSSSKPQPAQQRGGPREIPLHKWPMVTTPLVHLSPGPSLALWGGSHGTHPVLLHPGYPLHFLGPGDPRIQPRTGSKHPQRAENRGRYLAWALSPWSLLRRVCRRAEGGLLTPGVQWWGLQENTTGECEGRADEGGHSTPRSATADTPVRDPTRH